MNIEQLKAELSATTTENIRLRQLVISLGQEAVCAMTGRIGYHSACMAIVRRSEALWGGV